MSLHSTGDVPAFYRRCSCTLPEMSRHSAGNVRVVNRTRPRSQQELSRQYAGHGHARARHGPRSEGNGAPRPGTREQSSRTTLQSSRTSFQEIFHHAAILPRAGVFAPSHPHGQPRSAIGKCTPYIYNPFRKPKVNRQFLPGSAHPALRLDSRDIAAHGFVSIGSDRRKVCLRVEQSVGGCGWSSQPTTGEDGTKAHNAPGRTPRSRRSLSRCRWCDGENCRLPRPGSRRPARTAR